MILNPKKTKYRKAFKGRICGIATSGATLSFGAFGLKALEPERITARQIEAARKAINGYLKRAGKLWIRIFPDVPVSKKPTDVRMGSGKGSVEYWACRVRPGKMLFELDGITEEQALGALRRAAGKLPIKTRFVKRIEGGSIL
ncbi:50S ribosomal subunit protein L16 [Alphaproteobacteria bacterium]